MMILTQNPYMIVWTKALLKVLYLEGRVGVGLGGLGCRLGFAKKIQVLLISLFCYFDFRVFHIFIYILYTIKHLLIAI